MYLYLRALWLLIRSALQQLPLPKITRLIRSVILITHLYGVIQGQLCLPRDSAFTFLLGFWQSPVMRDDGLISFLHGLFLAAHQLHSSQIQLIHRSGCLGAFIQSTFDLSKRVHRRRSIWQHCGLSPGFARGFFLLVWLEMLWGQYFLL